jgi:hypothetical protein
MTASVRSIAARLFYFLLDQKVTKNQASRNAPLPHWPCPANQAKPGTQKFRAFATPRNPNASAKLAFPLQPHRPPSFCLISSGAVLLAENKTKLNLIKSGQRPDKKAGRAYGGNDGLAFRDVPEKR